MASSIAPFASWRRALLLAFAIESPLYLLSATACFGSCQLNLHAVMPLALFVLQLPGSFLAILADGGIVLSARALSGNPNALLEFSQRRFDFMVFVLQALCLALGVRFSQIRTAAALRP